MTPESEEDAFRATLAECPIGGWVKVNGEWAQRVTREVYATAQAAMGKEPAYVAEKDCILRIGGIFGKATFVVMEC